MNIRRLIFRSLLHYRRTHLWVMMGTMVSTAILVGAFIIGDSVRYSLRQIVFERLGATKFALSTGDRLFRAEWADELSSALGTDVAPLLRSSGIAVAGDGSRRVNRVEVLGVDARFGHMGGSREVYGSLRPDEAVVNEYLADRLNLRAGDELLLRVEKLDYMPKDAPLAQDADGSLARRVRIRHIASDAEFGRYHLRSDQVPPLTVFVSLSFLSRAMGLDDRANVLLVAEREDAPLELSTLNEALKTTWTLEDAALELRQVPGRQDLELRSSRVFLDPSVVEAALRSWPGARPVATYFVNEISFRDRSTPYSFVSAPGWPGQHAAPGDDEVIINQWLASDLAASPGDQIELSYFVVGPGRSLQEKTTRLEVKDVVPIEGAFADRSLLPDFPGLAGEENCRDWTPGIPLELDHIRDKDERYWDEYRGTPKAFVSMGAAESMWSNRFGSVTAIRFQELEKGVAERRLEESFDLTQLGYVFEDVKEAGLKASSSSVSFGQLFFGLSFFVVVAALLLTGLLFVFNAEQRASENGLYLALGFPKETVRRIVLLEGTVIIVTGSLLGCFVGLIYNQAVLFALKTVWQSAVGTSDLHIHVTGRSVLLGFLSGAFVAFLTIWLATRRQMSRTIVALQRGQATVEQLRGKRPWISPLVGTVCFLAAGILLLVTSRGGGSQSFDAFFLSGTLILVGGIALIHALLSRLGARAKPARLGYASMALRNAARMRLRSVTVVALLACGLFIVFAVGGNRLNAHSDAGRRDSGTGGFALFAESTLPILHDLNTLEDRRLHGLQSLDTQDVRFVPFRVREGDDASCLNLNQVTNPQLLGVDIRELDRRGAFTFAEATEEVDSAKPWSLLESVLPGGVVPAVADLSVIIWGLGKSVGDTLTYVDEKGKTFEIKLVAGLANSIFQGNVIISERNFIEKYPSESGYRILLADVSRTDIQAVADQLSSAFVDLGMDVQPAAVRLAAFNAVQNTYLSIFMILGSFGILLGCLGLGIVVWRNVKERREELALFRAVGFSPNAIRTLVLVEHVPLLMVGILLGLVAALLATLPSLAAPGAEIPFPTILLIFSLVGLNGTLWVVLAAKRALQEDLLPALRRE